MGCGGRHVGGVQPVAGDAAGDEPLLRQRQYGGQINRNPKSEPKKSESESEKSEPEKPEC